MEGWVRGVLEGAKHSLLRLLELRGVAVPIEVRERILACTDPVQLDLWFDRAFTAATAEDVVQVD
ncbi:hypothetical protein BCD48_24910 [Pseudofrankia sp. BMG5.36]|nr:hypothetical protein BCD48_24910 [Pseudofrankia sp. BMG5.36]